MSFVHKEFKDASGNFYTTGNLPKEILLYCMSDENKDFKYDFRKYSSLKTYQDDQGSVMGIGRKTF